MSLGNSYNLGNVSGLYAGSIIGNENTKGDVTLQKIYASNGMAEIGRSYSDLGTTFASEFGTLSVNGTNVTINSDNTTLLDALNAWVDANKSTYPELKNWVMGDNGYPTFEE